MQKEQQELANLIKGKKVAFIGAGVSHKTLIREFVELGAHVTLCDQKKSVEDFGDYAATIKELGIDLSLGENYLDGFKGQDIIMRTPGFVGYFEKPLQDAMAAGAMVTSEVELFFQFCPCEIVAVTGSDGKTTTTTLISKFYEAAGRKVHLGGNIGAALLPMLPEVSPDDVAVVELSSFQLISMHQSPNIAVVTNVTPNTSTTTRICRSTSTPSATSCSTRSSPAAPSSAMRTRSAAPCRRTARASRSGSPACTRRTTARSCGMTGCSAWQRTAS